MNILLLVFCIITIYQHTSKMLNNVNEFIEMGNKFYANFIEQHYIMKSTIKKNFETDIILTMDKFSMFIIVAVGIVVSAIGIKSLICLGKLFWRLLTPGQQWLEIALIVSGIALFYVLFLSANEMEHQISTAFTKLKKEIADRDAIIAEKDEKITKLEAIITTLQEGKSEYVTVQCCNEAQN